MDLRDQFAMAALQGLLSSDVEGHEFAGLIYWKDGEVNSEKLARHAYEVAEAMLAKKASLTKKSVPMIKS